jgi:magnesium transporter
VKNKQGGFMFYQFDDDVTSVDVNELNDNALAVGYVTVKELENIYKRFNIPFQAVELCKGEGELFSSIEVYDNMHFIRLSALSDDMKTNNSVGIFALKKLLLIVNISDKGFSNRDLFMKMLSRVSSENISVEKALIAFFECLVVIDDKRLDELRKSITDLEEAVIKNKVDNSFNIKLLELKRVILLFRGYYERLIDIAQVMHENDNELFDDGIKHLSLFVDKVKRLKDSADILTDSALHLWDAYQALLDLRLNETMKFFTLVTTIFFPLTVIVGWYGMNFNSMPELKWKYGYVYVIALSVFVVAILIALFKKKRWF